MDATSSKAPAARVAIIDTAYYLPETVVTNADLARENPSWDIARMEAQTGVARRHVVGERETALDLAVPACRQLFSRHAGLAEKIDGLLFCTQSPDHVMPNNACILHKLLDLGPHVAALDYNLGCSGYVYGLALARGLIVTGVAANVLLVTSDTLSRHIHPRDGSMRGLFADGAAVSWIAAADGDAGILDIECATHGRDYDAIMVPAGGMRLARSAETASPIVDKHGNVRTRDNVYMEGMRVMAFVNSKVAQQVRGLLARNGIERGAVDLFLWHQASKAALDSLARALEIPGERVFSNLRDVGNTTGASIPIALADALAQGRCRPGDLVVMSGFGIGLSWATALVRL